MDEKIAQLQKIIDESRNIVFFGGAGVSTESGIPDFRSVDGLYNQQWKYPPETIISHSFYLHDPVMPLNIEGGRKGDLAKLVEIAKKLTDGFERLDRTCLK